MGKNHISAKRGVRGGGKEFRARERLRARIPLVRARGMSCMHRPHTKSRDGAAPAEFLLAPGDSSRPRTPLPRPRFGLRFQFVIFLGFSDFSSNFHPIKTLFSSIKS